MDEPEKESVNTGSINDSSTSYIAEINKIKKSIQPSDTKLELLNILIKDFLRKKYHIKKNAEYSELIDYFLDKKKPHIATFCHEMVEELYSGDSSDENKVNLILDDAKILIQNEFNIKPESENESTFQNIMRPFMGKENKIDTSQEKNVSKQTKKIIDKYTFIKEDEPIKEDENYKPTQSQENGKEEKEILRNQLSLHKMSKETEQSIAELDDSGKIENIDDLDRIKEKIRMKKIYSDKNI
jgi:hypothetical protein